MSKSEATWLSAQRGVNKLPTDQVGDIWDAEYEAMVNCYVVKVEHYAYEWLESRAGQAIEKEIADYKYLPISKQLTEGQGMSSPPGLSRQRT
jgi:hypothetical protein